MTLISAFSSMTNFTSGSKMNTLVSSGNLSMNNQASNHFALEINSATNASISTNLSNTNVNVQHATSASL